MTRMHASASPNDNPRHATTRPAVGATDLAGLGSHLQSSPPEIRVDEQGLDHTQSLESNGLALDFNARLGLHGPTDDSENSPSQLSPVERSREHRASTRGRSDSFFLGSYSDTGSGACIESSSCGVETESEGDEAATPLIRRCSFVSTNPIFEDEEHNNASDSYSMPMDSDISSEDSDLDYSRLYTSSLRPVAQPSDFSMATSVVSDGGEQDHLEMRQSSDVKPESERAVSSSARGKKSQRYALQKQIYSAMEIARNDDASLPTQRFFPKDQLGHVINTSTVFAELTNCLQLDYTNDDIRAYANTICKVTPCLIEGRLKRKSFRSIFVILVLAERPEFIVSFLDEQVSDLDLPLIPVKDNGSIIGMRRRSPNHEGPPQPLLRCFNDEEWSPSSREQFDRYQWYMLAPFFSHGKYGLINHYPLNDQHILPFVTSHQAEDDSAESQGGYGRVIMVRLHTAHHKLGCKTDPDRGFAVKQLHSNDRRSFRREREILKKFSGANRHPHIVSLLATYRHRNKYHFIFDRAQSDLSKFWAKDVKHPELEHADMIWIVDQCLGITEGLFRIHRHRTLRKRRVHKVEDQAGGKRGKVQVTFVESADQTASDLSFAIDDQTHKHEFHAPVRSFSSENEVAKDHEVKYGRHGDINPQNILWFANDKEGPRASSKNLRGDLKIADFGAAEMNSRWSKTGDRDVANTMTYRPPECDSADRTIRQSFDIWCLGCVFLEFVTWTIGGAGLVQSFAKKRMSRDPAYSNYETDTYFELICNPLTGKTEAKIKDSVFQFVEKLHHKPRCTEFLHNLLNLVMHDMLIVDSRKRRSCKDICRELRKLRENCESETYAMGSSQWCNGEHVLPEILLRATEVELSKDAQGPIERNMRLRDVKAE
ncbi:hypothetical protein HBI81_151500 [Parastagonospora nodorum]|nr:hypothetical protein HBH53_208220 [Parastagonospora nodorum]KAH4049860.1 hypothetical protein HBH49_138420 [Parastagonospora nodorum]KAH5025130.1 hypothetical protein HBI74_127600 [Parastagonospora nodorum]KAH5175927.1 hypothetical protein HBH76_217790 [Parastagonospora nodorum]KAH5344705.1 hypothetical protein HBI49_220430 [Parastagonospora nodorum]